MSLRTLDTVGGTGGGPVQLAKDPGKARNIHVTVSNPTNATHGVWFGRSRREVDTTPTFGLAGFFVAAVPNTVANQTIGGVAYTSQILQSWVGELWAVADIAAQIQVDVFDSGAIEK
jgi:hypothetical protein